MELEFGFVTLHCNFRYSEHPDQQPILLFQVVDILYNVFQHLSATEILCGPSFPKMHAIFEQSLQKLSTSGVASHFFINEPACHRDVKGWNKRQLDQYLERIAVMDKIDSNRFDFDTIPSRQAGGTAPMMDLLALCESYNVFVHLCASDKYLEEVVKFANDNDAMAIVGNNSDFLVFNGNWRYWSCRDIDRKWKTLEYSKGPLLQHLGLTQRQMPMLATIAGNKFVPNEKILAFHKKVNGNKFPKLAEYVRSIPCALTNDKKREILMDVFGSDNAQNFQLMRRSLHFYATKSDDIEKESTVEPIYSSASAWYISSVYHNSLSELPIRIKAPTFYDLRRKDFLPYYDVVLPILQRQIGFVRQHKNDVDYEQVIHLHLNHSEPCKSMHVRPEYPFGEKVVMVFM